MLMVIDHQLNPEKYTKEQLKDNAAAADAYAAYAAYADGLTSDAAAEQWVNRYFEQTGENKQDYIDHINK